MLQKKTVPESFDLDQHVEYFKQTSLRRVRFSDTAPIAIRWVNDADMGGWLVLFFFISYFIFKNVIFKKKECYGVEYV